MKILFNYTILLLLISFVPKCLISQSFIPGQTYLDTTGYVEYRAGNLPIILSAPHGGSLKPIEIPDRECSGCVLQNDSWTKPITQGIYDAIVSKTGCYPHVIMNLLHRNKFDANRAIEDAADGNFTVERSWASYHDFIEASKAQIENQYSRGLFLDIHGHAHTIQRVELGYLLSGSELRMSDSILNTDALIEESSILTLVADNLGGLSHASLLRGHTSLGTILNNQGLAAVPSTSDSFPMVNESYFSGGYNTARHGSRDNSGNIDAIQIELNQEVRFDETKRENLIDSLASAIIKYISFHYEDQFTTYYCNQVSAIIDQNIKESNVQIYPNPAADYINLITEKTSLQVDIFNHLGFHLQSQIWSGQEIDIRTIPCGLYFVRLSIPNSPFYESYCFSKI